MFGRTTAIRLRTASQQLLRSERYSFSPYNPQTNWHRWKESELLHAMPPNDHVKPSPFNVGKSFWVFGFVGTAVTFFWAYTRRNP